MWSNLATLSYSSERATMTTEAGEGTSKLLRKYPRKPLLMTYFAEKR
jgi:hypothetical protein